MSALPKLEQVHRLTADAIEAHLRLCALARANLDEEVLSIRFDSVFYPGPINTVAYGETNKHFFSLSPVVGWSRGSVHLFVWLDGSGDWDYSDLAHPSSYGRHAPRWIEPSREHLADVYSDSGVMDLFAAVNFADWWGLELMPLIESQQVASSLHCR